MKEYDLIFKRPNGVETSCIFYWAPDKDPVITFMTAAYKAYLDLRTELIEHKPEIVQEGKYFLYLESSKEVFETTREINFFMNATQQSSMKNILEVLGSSVFSAMVEKAYFLFKKGK